MNSKMSSRQNNHKYGAIPSSNASRSAVVDDHGEETGLLHKPAPPSFTGRLHRHMFAEVSTHWTDLILLTCYVITGLLDSSSVLIWGSFVSMQTGNTIYLGSGIVRPSADNRWIRALISLGSFLAGSFCFARFHRLCTPRRRWVILASNLAQLGLVITAAVMVTVSPEDQHAPGPITAWIAVPIALVAFQSAGQAVMSRVVRFNSLTSIVLTSVYCDLAADAHLFAPLTANAERNRRAAAAVLLCTGAVIGGVWAESEVGMMGALWTAVGLKGAVIVAWLCWAPDHEEEEN